MYDELRAKGALEPEEDGIIEGKKFVELQSIIDYYTHQRYADQRMKYLEKRLQMLEEEDMDQYAYIMTKTRTGLEKVSD